MSPTDQFYDREPKVSALTPEEQRQAWLDIHQDDVQKIKDLRGLLKEIEPIMSELFRDSNSIEMVSLIARIREAVGE